MIFGTALLAAVGSLRAQTPEKTPESGKSYDLSGIKRPATTAPQFPSPVTFSDITVATRVEFRHWASPTAVKYLPETMGAGVALFDFNNDGMLDVFFTNGALIEEAMGGSRIPEKTDPKFWNRLYRQSNDGTFEDVTLKSGLKGDGYAFGTAVGDVDRDGFQDLFVTRYGGATLYRNKGDGTFEDVTQRAGIVIGGWPTSAGFFDYDRDGRLDIFVARYVQWNFELGKIFCGDTRPGYRAYCHPDNFKPSANVLLRQKADGTFEDASQRSGVAGSGGKALGVAFGDFDDDGWPDVFVANDNYEQQLFRNNGNGSFENVALPAGVAYDERGRRFAGMGIDISDFDLDGRQDVIVTALSNETYPFYRNVGELAFDYVTQSSGVAQISILGAGWGIKWVDADNDGRRDLLVAQSHVLDTIEKTTTFLKYKQTPLLMRNTEKGFQNVSEAAGEVFQKDLSARGLAVGDIDNDGDIDAVIAQTDGPPVFLRNNGTANAWIGFDLAGVRSAPNGEGARIIVTDAAGRRQIIDVSNSGSYLSANDRRVLVGLGQAKGVRSVEIRWPSGTVQRLDAAETGRYHLVKEK
jgi:hypothetical protein